MALIIDPSLLLRHELMQPIILEACIEMLSD